MVAINTSPVSIGVNNIRDVLKDCSSFAQQINGKLFGYSAPEVTGKANDAIEPSDISWNVDRARAELDDLRTLLSTIENRI